MLKLGVMIEGQEGLNWERWRRIVEAADRLGYDSVWRSDHLFSVMGRHERETVALIPSLTAVPIWSDRLTFGQLVSPVSFRNPVHLAYDAVALDRLSNGRHVFGIGAGWNVVEHRAFGFQLLPLKERFDRFEEAIRLIKLLWTGEPVSFDGEYFQLDDARAALTPSRPSGVPLLIGGGGERRTLRMVAEHADEWNMTPMPPEEYQRKAEILREHCRAVGRDPDTIRHSIMLTHLMGRDEHELRERARRLIEITGRQGTVDDVLANMRAGGRLVGTPDEVVAQMRDWEARGIKCIMLQTLDMDDIAVLELIASEIMPHVS